jgi:hypothetical protein
MGGGGGGSSSIGDVNSLIQRAKEDLRESAREGKRNVFISFAFEDVGTVNLLRGQAKNENLPLEFNDWSVSEPIDSDRAGYVKQRIAERIAQSSVTVVFLSDSTPASAWVEWEIAESVRQQKHVIGVYPQDSRPRILPDAISAHKIRCVPWPKLPQAIESLK